MSRPDTPRDNQPAPNTVIVVAGGDAPSATDLAGLPAEAFVIGVDSGIGHAQALGLTVGLAIGDFDSVAPADLARVEQAGGEVVRYPTEKDATDLELALDAALARRPNRIVVLGAGGGRDDHHLANLLLLAAPAYRGPELQARLRTATVTVVHDTITLTGTPGDLLTLLPVHGPAIGVLTSGLRYPLVREELPVGTSRGVSNVFAATTATVSLKSGTLLAFHPRCPLSRVSPSIPSSPLAVTDFSNR